MPTLQIIDKTNIFLSGNFSDTRDELAHILQRLSQIGFNISMMTSDSPITARDLIAENDYFMCVVGVQPGEIRLPNGTTLPQEELAEAIKQKKKIIPIIKNPEVRSTNSRQQDMRDTLIARYGRDILSYSTNHGINLISDLLQSSGVERFSRVLRPLRGFVSYSRLDLGIVSDVVRDMKKSGFPVFFDEHSIEVGQSISETIRTAIDEVGYVLVCISDNAISSKWVRQEIRWALETVDRLTVADTPFIIPVKVGEFTWPAEFDHLGDTKYADVYSNFEKGMDQIKGVLM